MSETTVPNNPSIAVIGCGPKALAIAAKAKVLSKLGIADIKVDIIEEDSIASNWNGRNGFTDGRQTLGTPPEKDLGFPYQSTFGKLVDEEMFRYSWATFSICHNKYGEWIDKGKKQPKHQDWADYLKWAYERVNPALHLGRASDIKLKPDAIEISITDQNRVERKRYYHGLVITGPGEPVKIHDSKHEWSENIVNGQLFWLRKAIFEGMKTGKIAIIGGGETAASIVVALIESAPNLEVHLINRHGTIFTRGESYHENELYTYPEKWNEIGDEDKEEFIKRTDRGVFSVAAKEIIDQASNIKILTGNVLDVIDRRRDVVVKIQRQKNEYTYEYDKVVVAIGFNPVAALKMLPDHLRPTEWLRQVKNYVDHHLRIPLPLDGDMNKITIVNLHMPMLAAFAQGPGFPNLSCLGTLADRVLSAYIP